MTRNKIMDSIRRVHGELHVELAHVIGDGRVRETLREQVVRLAQENLTTPRLEDTIRRIGDLGYGIAVLARFTEVGDVGLRNRVIEKAAALERLCLIDWMRPEADAA